jgi:preprotein translocase subunit SecD
VRPFNFTVRSHQSLRRQRATRPPSMSSLSFNTKRVIVAFALLAVLICLGNYYFEWNVFGSFAKIALVLSFVALWAVIHFVGPTLREIEDYRRKNPHA